MKFPNYVELDKYVTVELDDKDNDWRPGTIKKVTVVNHRGEILYEDAHQDYGEPEDNAWGRDLDQIYSFGENVMYYSLLAWFQENIVEFLTSE